MFRNQYDTDITTYSPQGRLHQVEYAMEAVKQGSASVGVRSKTHVVLATLKRFASELSGDQKKLFAIDDHVVIAISGLTADARVLSRYMRTETQHHKFMYEEPMPVGRLVLQVADKCQVRLNHHPIGGGGTESGCWWGGFALMCVAGKPWACAPVVQALWRRLLQMSCCTRQSPVS